MILDDLTLLAADRKYCGPADRKYCGPYPASQRMKKGEHDDLTMLVNKVHDADLALKSVIADERGRSVGAANPLLRKQCVLQYSIISEQDTK